MKKYINIDDVINISNLTLQDKRVVILFKLANGNEYYANGEVERIKDVFYCHYEFTIWSNY